MTQKAVLLNTWILQYSGTIRALQIQEKQTFLSLTCSIASGPLFLFGPGLPVCRIPGIINGHPAQGRLVKMIHQLGIMIVQGPLPDLQAQFPVKFLQGPFLCQETLQPVSLCGRQARA